MAAASDGPQYECISCGYGTNRKNNWLKHIATAKHKRLSGLVATCDTSPPQQHLCPYCGKQYKHLASLSRHRRDCRGGETSRSAGTELVELKKLVQEIAERPVHQTTNVNVYLTQACPSALDIKQFVEALPLTHEDLMYTRRNGYVEGLSQLLIKGLSSISPLERPIHCQDGSMGLYIKDQGKWAKDGDGKLLGQQLRLLTQKQLECLRSWESANPNWRESEPLTRMYLAMVGELVGNREDERNLSLLVERRLAPLTSIRDIGSR